MTTRSTATDEQVSEYLLHHEEFVAAVADLRRAPAELKAHLGALLKVARDNHERSLRRLLGLPRRARSTTMPSLRLEVDPDDDPTPTSNVGLVPGDDEE